jgi:hypothetical protein
VEWYFNEEVVSGKNFLVSSSGDRHTLAIFQISAAHSGIVACVAENEAGKATCVARLSVRSEYKNIASCSVQWPIFSQEFS